ncbi:MAG TPA: hypothetical protein VE379_08650 [Vicinamibacterales bacterium]|jgi:hypothetical protein|nr:hypothetical protein [Vicinamibacterales bacterium]
MAAPAAKAPHAPALEMRLSVPVDGTLNDVAVELATKLAEFLGAESASIGGAIGMLTSRVASAGENVTFEFRHIGRELVIRAHCNGRSAEERRPLTA